MQISRIQGLSSNNNSMKKSQDQTTFNGIINFKYLENGRFLGHLIETNPQQDRELAILAVDNGITSSLITRFFDSEGSLIIAKKLKEIVGYDFSEKIVASPNKRVALGMYTDNLMLSGGGKETYIDILPFDDLSIREVREYKQGRNLV